ncbi:MAG: hypothetical protein K9M45_12840 [Kiritimatiellales bacterium]|nr:hypothetical protein [Kiritimatiellales bacterium]
MCKTGIYLPIFNRLPLFRRDPRLDTAERIAGHFRGLVDRRREAFFCVLLTPDFRPLHTADLSACGPDFFDRLLLEISDRPKTAHVAFACKFPAGSEMVGASDVEEFQEVAEQIEADGVGVLGCIIFREGTGAGANARADRNWLALWFGAKPTATAGAKYDQKR